MKKLLFLALTAILVGSFVAACSKSSTTTAPTGAAVPYAHPELLTETDWLAQHLSDPNVRIVDVRSASDYGKGHIQGSVNLDTLDSKGQMYDQASKVQWTVLTKTQAETVFSKIGIGDNTTVVAVDDSNMLWASRLFWTLEYYGHGNGKAKVLNGDLKKWKAESRPLVTDVPVVQPAKFTAVPQPALIATETQILGQLGKPGVPFILAAIPSDEFHGGNAKNNSLGRGGHIPGALQLDWTTNLTGDPQVFKSAADLAAQYAQIGFTKDKNGIVY